MGVPAGPGLGWTRHACMSRQRALQAFFSLAFGALADRQTSLRGPTAAPAQRQGRRSARGFVVETRAAGRMTPRCRRSVTIALTIAWPRSVPVACSTANFVTAR